MTSREFADMIVDRFEEMRGQSRDHSLVMRIAGHPHMVGQPDRLRHLRRALVQISATRDTIWFTTPGKIVEARDPRRSAAILCGTTPRALSREQYLRG